MNKQQGQKLQRKVTLISLAISTFVFGMLFLLVSCALNDDKNSNELYPMCYIYSQRIVKEKLKSPSSAKFPLYDESFVEDKGDTIIISAYVDADNSYGANKRTDYIATIQIKNGKPQKGVATLLE